MSETKSEKPIEIGFDSENNPADTASNYPCPLFNCRHTFIKLKHLKQHVLFHAGMLPHVCQVCGQGFKVVQNMEYHLVEKHQVDFQVSTMFNAKSPRGFFVCNVCLSIVPLKEKKAHIQTHLPI